MATQTFGPYQVVRELARGGMGAVYHARSPEGRDVAVKVILKPGAKDALARFGRERRLLSELGEAEGYVPILDAGEERTGPFLVMPLIGGGTLRDRIERGPLAIEDALALAGKLAAAAGRAHALGIVHRDLKPENVLFTKRGEPLIADLGLAKHFREDAPGAGASISLSKTGEFRGTLGYMAPEQTGNARDAGPPADVFALGAILFECLTGQSPFDGVTANEVLAKVASDTVTSVRTLRPDAPRWLVPLLARALRVDPARRFPDGGALARALAEGPALARRRARRSLALTLGFAAVCAAGVGLVLGHHGVARTGEAAPVSSATGALHPHESPRSRENTRPRAPEWYLALPESERPSFPLPAGLSFGPAPRVYVNDKDASELVFVPSGVYTIGTSSDESMQSHTVQLSAYFMGRTELTLEKFERFAKATGLETAAEKEKTGSITFGYDSNPVNVVQDLANLRMPDGKSAADPHEPVAQITWDEASAYCRWAGLELPTEAQWEVAAGWDPKAKRSHDYPWGADGSSSVVASDGKLRGNLMDEGFMRAYPLLLSGYRSYDDGWVRAAPVGTFPDGVSALGCEDMCGNVREFVRDFYDVGFYRRSPRFDPVGTMDPGLESMVSMHVVRGGSFATSTQWGETWHRASAPTDRRAWDLGFRVSRPGR